MTTHGKTFAATCGDDTGTASDGNSASLSCLVAEIDAHPLPRKALAGECGKSEQTFSKMTAGTQAFGVDDFGKLPRDLQVKWMQRYGREYLGVTVRELEPSEIAEEFHALVDRLASVSRLARVIRGPKKQAKADLRTDEKTKAANW